MKAKRGNRRWLMGCLIALGTVTLLSLVALGVLIFYVGDLFSDLSQCDSIGTTQASLESTAAIVLPPSTSNFTMTCSGFIDNHELVAQFNIAPSELDTLQTALARIDTWTENATVTDEVIESLDDSVTLAQVEAMDSYIYGEGSGTAALVNTSEADIYTVYFTVFIAF